MNWKMFSIDLRRVVAVGLAVGLTSTCAQLFLSRTGAANSISTGDSSSLARLARVPNTILWAWEQPSDLRTIDPNHVGVAFLASSIYLSGKEVAVRPRLQPLQVPPETFLMATIRIETHHTRHKFDPPRFSTAQRAQATAAIVNAAGMLSVQAVQIDFDATVSERAFYRDLLSDVRIQLPPTTAISITALASWCSGDNWLRGMPIDEAVPMLFRMGPDRREILRSFRADGKFVAEVCNQSIGTSTDEPLGALPGTRRVYIFRPGPWTEKTVRAALGGLPQ